MKITKIVTDNSAEIHYENGAIIFYSYEAPVAYISGDKSVAGRTCDFYSQTTTKHINKFLVKHGFSAALPKQGDCGSVVWSSEKELETLVEEFSDYYPKVRITV